MMVVLTYLTKPDGNYNDEVAVNLSLVRTMQTICVFEDEVATEIDMGSIIMDESGAIVGERLLVVESVEEIMAKRGG